MQTHRAEFIWHICQGFQVLDFLKKKNVLLPLRIWTKPFLSSCTLFLLKHLYSMFTSSCKMLLFTYLYSILGGRTKNPGSVLHFSRGTYRLKSFFFLAWILSSHRVPMERVIFNKTLCFEELVRMSSVMLKQHRRFQNAVWSIPALPHNAITVKGLRQKWVNNKPLNTTKWIDCFPFALAS